MLLTRTDPFAGVDRLMDRVLGSGVGPQMERGLPLDVTWKGDALVLHFDVPGVPEDAIDITVKDRVLTVTAERPAPERAESDRVLVQERTWGRWTRAIRLGDQLDPEGVDASIVAGVLTVTVPASPAAAPRKVAIHRGETPAVAAPIETEVVEPTHN